MRYVVEHISKVWRKSAGTARRPRSYWAACRILTVSLVVILGGANRSSALSVERCVSTDNHVYMIVTTTNAFTQVTSVAMTSGNASACSENPAAGQVLTSAATGQGSLLPDRVRTAILSGFTTNQVSCAGNFVANAAGGKGVLTLPGGAVTVSADPASSTAATVAVATADVGAPGPGLVPAAVDVAGLSRSITGCSTGPGVSMVFPTNGGATTYSDSTSGEVASQTVTLDDTEGSGVGNRAPGHTTAPTQANPDGFGLQGNCSIPSSCQIIVFIGHQNGSPGFGVAVAGFTTATSEGIVTSTENAAQNENFNTPTPTTTPTNTNTPTPTPTPTNTFTPTPTPTPTNTNTPTPTPTPTNTFTPTPTPTPTPTRTPSPSFTPTPTPTNTRPPVPVVPSPTSPAGLVMIGALGIGLLWALRRFGRTVP